LRPSAAFRFAVCRAYVVAPALTCESATVPVTAKLSKQFYERLGEAVTNELVDWFNQVDAAYKSDLRAINELNYARFEARLEQRVAELRADIRGIETSLERALKEQTRFYFLAWAVLLASNIALWFR
jgi:hypothetical protein